MSEFESRIAEKVAVDSLIQHVRLQLRTPELLNEFKKRLFNSKQEQIIHTDEYLREWFRMQFHMAKTFSILKLAVTHARMKQFLCKVSFYFH